MFSIRYQLHEIKEDTFNDMLSDIYDVYGPFELVVNDKRYGTFYEDGAQAIVLGEWQVRWFLGLLECVSFLRHGTHNKTVYVMEVETFDRWMQVQKREDNLILNVVHAARATGDGYVTARPVAITSREWGEGETVSYLEFVSEILRQAKNFLADLIASEKRMKDTMAVQLLADAIEQCEKGQPLTLQYVEVDRTQAYELRRRFIDAFVDQTCERYITSILPVQANGVRICRYDAYLRDCLKYEKCRVATIFQLIPVLAGKGNQPVYVMWDLRPKKTEGAFYGPWTEHFSSDTVIEVCADHLAKILRQENEFSHYYADHMQLSEDLYIFDSTMSWFLATTHSDIQNDKEIDGVFFGKGNRLCYMGEI